MNVVKQKRESQLRNLLDVAHRGLAKVYKSDIRDLKISVETNYTLEGIKISYTVTVKGQIVLSSPMIFGWM